MDTHLNILLIDDDDPPDPLLVIRCFSNIPNVHIHVSTSVHPKHAPWRYSRYVNSVHYTSPEKDAAYLGQLIETIKKTEAHVVLPITIPTIGFMSENRNAIKGITHLPPLPEKRALDEVTNKWTLNEFLKNHGFPHTQALIFNNNDDVRKNLSQLNFPVLLKPVSGYGGIGIRKFDNPDDLLSYLETEIILPATHIFQEFIFGYKRGINLLADRGAILAHSIQKGIVPEKFEHSQAIEFIKNKQLLELTKSIISELNWSGIANLDFYFDTIEKNFKLIDFNARFWSTTIGSHCAGINFPYLACLTALNEPYPSPSYSNTNFLLTKAAIKEYIKNFTRKEKNKFCLKQTNIYYILKDPMPEIISFPSRLLKGINSYRQRRSQSS